MSDRRFMAALTLVVLLSVTTRVEVSTIPAVLHEILMFIGKSTILYYEQA